MADIEETVGRQGSGPMRWVVVALPIVISLAAAAASATSCSVAREAEQRAVAQYDTEYAKNVAIDEVPGRFPPRWAVVNANSSRIGNVWVRTTGGAVVNVEAVPRCTMYMFPPEDRPDVVYFRDAHGSWRRGLDDPPERTDEGLPPSVPSQGVEPLPVDQCG